jgi:hypothetical protein
MASNCTPPLSAPECIRALKTGFKPEMKKLSYHRMANDLGVTPHEAEIITQTIGKPFPPSVSFGEWIPSTTFQGHCKRTPARQARREVITAIVGGGTEIPSLRKMQRILFERGIEASYVTIRKDYQTLGIRTPAVPVRAKKGQDPLFDPSIQDQVFVRSNTC